MWHIEYVCTTLTLLYIYRGTSKGQCGEVVRNDSDTGGVTWASLMT